MRAAGEIGEFAGPRGRRRDLGLRWLRLAQKAKATPLGRVRGRARGAAERRYPLVTTGLPLILIRHCRYTAGPSSVITRLEARR